MPKRKQKQTNQNDYIPLNEDDVKHATEVAVKEINDSDLVTIEKPGKNIKKRKVGLKNRTIKEEFEPEETDNEPKEEKAKTDKYQLILCEKPQAAEKIASSLGNFRKLSENKVSYYQGERDNKKIIIASAVGHLFTLTSKEKGFPVFDIDWKADFKKNPWAKKYYSLLTKLSKHANEFIIASVDYNESTPIIEKGNMKIVKIGELVDDILDNKKKTSDFLVPAFDRKGKIRFKKLKKAIRHKINERLYELLLSYGRKVRLTSSHNIFTIKDNKIILQKTSDLKEGNMILCPAILPTTNIHQNRINLLNLKYSDNKREIYIGGEDIAKILKERIIKKKRKIHYLNDKRVILTRDGLEVIKSARLNKKYSTAEATRRAKISQSLIVVWENKLKNPSKINFIKYLRVIGINPKKFIANRKYCQIEKSSFLNLLDKVYKTQHKNFSNLERATIKLSDLKQEEIGRINKAFIYGSKNKRNKLPVSIKIEKKLIRVLGYFLAEGDINQNYRIRFSLGKENFGHEHKIIQEIKEFCKEYKLKYNYYIHKKIKHQILTIDNSVLASSFKAIFKFGKGATKKRVPSIVLNLPFNLKKEFLRAYFLGDGSLSRGNISFSTSSELLASDLSYLLLQLGILTSTHRVNESGKGGGPNWHIIVSSTNKLKSIRDIWKDHHNSKILHLSDFPKERRGEKKFGDLVMLKIKNIRGVRASSSYIYDLSVDGQNFIAGNGGVCCHNTDYDVEGEVIGWNIIRFVAGKNAEKTAKRMKFSTLTKQELESSYDNLQKTINWGQAYAGETRHFLDWMYGINLSRALMSAIKSAGRFKILSIGRVQGPALNLIVKKELEIQKFKSEPYWQVFINLKGHKPELIYEKNIKKKNDLDKFKNLKNQEGEAATEKKLRNLSPPYPFDLTSLQREAYRLFGINPSRTLQLAQNLYLAGLISYPRTSSQKIPPEIQPLKILNKLKNKFPEVNLTTRKMPIEGGKSDPAHPSIYPTGEQGTMNADEKKIYNLIAKRFISCFCEDALVEDKRITFITDKSKLKFLAKGLEIKEKNWLNVYPIKIKEQEIEDIQGKKTIEKSRVEEKLTQPPRRYTPASIITELEKKSLGTKSTRANIIETLYNRNYIKEQSIQATPLGINLISSLEKHSKIIIDEKLTRHFEREMTSIQEAKKNLKNLQDITIKEAKKTITKISEDMKKNEDKIGKELVNATEENYKEERENNLLEICPVCKKAQLRIIFNRKFKRSFIGCSNYPKCKTTFSLPPGMIKIIKDKEGKIQLCEHCGFPKLMRILKGKRPWIFCFNPSCPTNEEWQNKKKDYKP